MGLEDKKLSTHFNKTSILSSFIKIIDDNELDNKNAYSSK